MHSGLAPQKDLALQRKYCILEYLNSRAYMEDVHLTQASHLRLLFTLDLDYLFLLLRVGTNDQM